MQQDLPPITLLTTMQGAALKKKTLWVYEKFWCCAKISKKKKKKKRKRAECFESAVSEERTRWVLRQTRWVLRKNSVSSLWHANNRLRGTHWVLSPELGEGQKTHWARCLKPYSPKPYPARPRILAGWLPKTTCFAVFLKTSFANFEGWNLHPLNLGSMGCQVLVRMAQNPLQSLSAGLSSMEGLSVRMQRNSWPCSHMIEKAPAHH